MPHLSPSLRRELTAFPILAATLCAAQPALAAPLAVTDRQAEPAPFASRTGERVAVLDFNGDGISDHVVAGTNAVTVYFGARGSATGGGTTTVSVNVGGAGNVGVASAGDFDGDGRDDLLLINQKGATRTYVLHGAATNPATLTVEGNARTTDITNGVWASAETRTYGIGDFNGDGKDDALVPTSNGTNSSNGPLGYAILFGGTRTATLNARVVSDRVSRVVGYQHCYTTLTWFGFIYTSCQLPIPSMYPLGDVNADGFTDLYVNLGQGRAESIILGRAGKGVTISAASPGSKSVSLNALPGAGEQSRAVGAGDVNGDGIDDVLKRGYIVPLGVHLGRRDLPATLPADEPVLPIEVEQGRSIYFVGPVGDQNGDGRDDLLFLSSKASGGDHRLVVATLRPGATSFALADQILVGGNLSAVPGAAGGSLTAGDLDGDGATDTVVNDHDAIYRLTHSGGEVSRPRLQASTRYVDTRGGSHAPSTTTYTAACGGASQTIVAQQDDVATFGADNSFARGDRCTVTTVDSPPAALSSCLGWSVSYRFRGQAVGAGAELTLGNDPNRWEQTRTCTLDDTPPPPAFPIRDFAGWQQSGGASTGSSATNLALTTGPNKTASSVAPKPLDPNGKRFSFQLSMQGGNGAAEGVTFAFLDDLGGQPSGLLGTGGGHLGFGGLVGKAIAFDAAKQPEDAQANTVSLVDGVQGSALQKIASKDAGLRLRGPAVSVTVDVKDGKITVTLNKTRVHTYSATLPNSVFPAFTASTSGTWQHQAISAYSVQELP